MNNIITPTEAVALAFRTGEYAAPETITEADIAAAAHRYIEPVIGRELAAALAAGRYAELRDGYAAPALALAVRIMLQPEMEVRTGQAGCIVQKTASADPAAAEARAALHRSLRMRLRTALRRLSDRADACAAEYPEYDPRKNILKHCTLDGGFIQIH